MTNVSFTSFTSLEEATDWAMEHLEPYAMHDFVRDWKTTKDVTAWVTMVEECQSTPTA